MSDDEIARSSLLRTRHHTAQREHARQPHQRMHKALNKKQELSNDLVTEIVATISIIQQINVDQNGNTIGIETIQTHLTPNVQPSTFLTEAPAQIVPVIAEPSASPLLPSSPKEPAAPPSNPPSPPPVPTEPIPNLLIPPQSTHDELLPSEPLAPSDPALTTPTDYEATVVDGFTDITTSTLDATAIAPSFPPETTTFPSLTASLNSTSILSVLKNSTQTYSNSSQSLTSSTSTISRSRTLLSSSITDSISTSSPLLEAPTGDGIVAAGTGVAPGLLPENTAQSAAEATGDNRLPPTPVVVGGVIGSIAGVAVLIVAVLYFIRWRRRNEGVFPLSNGSTIGDGRATHEEPGSGVMRERRSAGFAIPANLAAIANKRFSRHNEPIDTSAAPVEKGFYRISGRKLPSVLQTGGDGYGGGPVIDNDTSFYRDSHAFFGGRGPPSPPLGTINRRSTGGVPIFRPSPARTPTREESPFNFVIGDAPSPPHMPDHVGRSHVSQDGSHASRFTEEV